MGSDIHDSFVLNSHHTQLLFFVVFFKLEVEPTSVLEWEITYKISLQGK